MQGFILVDKQPGCTSFDVVAKIRNLTKQKTGHSGTLDPFASGVLPIAVGKSTRLIELIESYDKVSYEDFKDIKYDNSFPSKFNYSFMDISIIEKLKIDPENDLFEILDIIQKWDRKTDIDSQVPESMEFFITNLYGIIEIKFKKIIIRLARRYLCLL